MNVGFVGLGYLGKAIAGRLQSCGHSLTVWNRTPGKEEGLEVTVASSAAQLTSDSEVICLCMFDSEAVRAVLTDPEGVLAGDVSGKVIVDFTTNHFKEVLEFYFAPDHFSVNTIIRIDQNPLGITIDDDWCVLR